MIDRAKIRAAIPDDPGGTHWDGCEVAHPWCAVRGLLGELAEVEGRMGSAAHRIRSVLQFGDEIAEEDRGELNSIIQDLEGEALAHLPPGEGAGREGGGA